MTETGGLDIGMPDEGQGGASEQASEEARQRFAGTQSALQQLAREEKKSKRRDDGVAGAILQFLTDDQRTHFATLIARLVALNCPSPFILAILSLINPRCKEVLLEYLQEDLPEGQASLPEAEGLAMTGQLDDTTNRELADWIVRLEATLSRDPVITLRSLHVGDGNLDGTVLQLTTFVLQEFLQERGKEAPFEKLQQLGIGILQSVFAPHLERHRDTLTPPAASAE